MLRLRPWDAQYHLDEFFGALLADAPLDEVLAPLTRSIAALLEADAVAVCHGFDGTRFAGAVGCGLLDVAPLREVGLWDMAASGTVALADGRGGRRVGGTGLDDVATLEACWIATVPGGQGLAPAVLSVWRATPGPPLVGHRLGLQRVMRFVQLALVRTAEHERLQHLAAHDPLTGVANRGEFRDRLARALAIGERDFAVAFCDLDRFKPVNDTYGHRVGDQVLVQVVDRMRSALRAGDELARAGGDEFTVLVRNVPTRRRGAATSPSVSSRSCAPVRRRRPRGAPDALRRRRPPRRRAHRRRAARLGRRGALRRQAGGRRRRQLVDASAAGDLAPANRAGVVVVRGER